MKKFGWIGLLGIISTASFANGIAPFLPVVSLGVGADAPLFSVTEQALVLVHPRVNLYTSSNPGTVSTVGTAFLGGELPLSDLYKWQIGLAYYYTANYGVQGTVSRFVDPSFQKFTYTYHIHTQRVLLESKLMGTWDTILHPYVTGGVGAASNDSSNYKEFNVSGAPNGHAWFRSHTSTGFSGAVGAGADLDIFRNARIGFKYQHAWLGSASLGTIPNQATNDVLHISNLTVNEFIFQATYVFANS